VILGVEGVLLDFELPPTSLPGGRPSPNGWLVDELVNALPILYLSYRRLKEKGKLKKVARIAAARKLLPIFDT